MRDGISSGGDSVSPGKKRSSNVRHRSGRVQRAQKSSTGGAWNDFSPKSKTRSLHIYLLIIFSGAYIGWALFTMTQYDRNGQEPVAPPHPAPKILKPVPRGEKINSENTVGNMQRAGVTKVASSQEKRECVMWAINLKGERYTHDWSALTYKGLTSDTFKTLTVMAGSEKDPKSGLCTSYGQDQKVLITETGYLVGALSCSNQEITIISKSSSPRPCEPEDEARKETKGKYSAYYKGPTRCKYIYECNRCVRHGSSDTSPDKIITGEDPKTKCVWCPSANSCMAYRDGSGQFPCPDAVGKGGGYPVDKCPGSSGKKYLSFQWNNGRVNNNMVSWAAALAVGQHLNRVVILAQPIQKGSGLKGYQNGDPNHGKSAYLGILEGMWDLEFIRENGFEIILETELEDSVLDVALFKTPAECVVRITEFPDPEKYKDCKVVHLADPFRFKSFRAQKPKEFIRPAKWIRDASERLIKEKMGTQSISVTVHQRHHNWGHADKHGSKFLCRGILKNIHKTPAGQDYRNGVRKWGQPESVQKRMLDNTQLSCAMNYEELQTVAAYWKKKIPEHFFLASDREELDRYQDMLKNGAVTIEEADYAHMPEIKEVLQKHLSFAFDCTEKYCANLKKIKQLTGVYLDMWGMVSGDFFFGGYYSTMSDTVCYWRGWNKMNASNICFLPMRLQKKWVRLGKDIDDQ